MKFLVLLFFCVGFLGKAAGLKEDFQRDVAVAEFEQQEKQNIDIVVSPDAVAFVDIEIGDLSEPIQDVDIYVMVDVSDMSAWQRKKVANAVIKMVDDLRAVNASRQVRVGLGTLVNRQTGSHVGGRREQKHAQRLVHKANRMLKNCHGRKCRKWLKLKHHNEVLLTPIIHTSFRHQLDFTDDLSDLKEILANATETGEAHVVGSQWEALLRASSCSEIGNFSTEVQRIILYINNDGILEPKVNNHKRRKSSDNSLKCSNGEPFVHWHRHELNKHHAHLKLSSKKVANSLMQARVRLVAAVPYSKKAFMTKRTLKSVSHVEVFPFSKSFVDFGEKAAVRIEEMLTAAPNGMIHNATWPLIVLNVATPCSKRQLKKAAKKNKPLKCGAGNPKGWNVTVETEKCSRRKQMESPIYFEIWAYNYNKVIGVNTTVLCKDSGNREDIVGQPSDDEPSDDRNEDKDEDIQTEDPDEATTADLPNQTPGCSAVRDCVVCNFGDKDEDLCGECKVKIQPVVRSEVESMESCQAQIEDDCPINYYIASVGRSSAAAFVLAEINCEDKPDSEIDGDYPVLEPEVEGLYGEGQAEHVSNQTSSCSAVRDCVVCNFGEKEAELCGECTVKIQPIDKSEVESMESCQAELDDNCPVNYYITKVGRPLAASSVLAEINCGDEDNE